MKKDHVLRILDKEADRVNSKSTVIISVFLWGLCAHLTGFTSALFSHDSLRELYTEGFVGYAGSSATEWKIALGRFFWPVYQSIFRLNGTTVLPFWNGLLGLLWLSITATLIVDIFNITKKYQVVLLGGILTCNLAVIATGGTYIGDFDANLFGVMLATLAVKQWLCNDTKSWFAILYLALAMGIYQSNVSVFISIVIFLSILRLLNNEDSRHITKCGFQAIIVIILAGSLYFLLSYLVSSICQIALASSPNGVAKIWNNQIGLKGCISNLLVTYKIWIYDFILLDKGLLSLLNTILFLSLAVIGLLFLRDTIYTINKFIVCILVVILPFCMNVAGFLNGAAHLLMTYSFWLLYLLALLLPELLLKQKKKKHVEFIRRIIALCICLILVNNVKLANGVYLKKNIERQSTLSYMTRVVDYIERIEGFDSRNNDVLFIGLPNIQSSSAYSSVSFITGAGKPSQISGVDVFQVYFDYILQYPITTVNKSDRKAILEKIDLDILENYPSPKCYSWVDQTLVIKLQ